MEEELAKLNPPPRFLRQPELEPRSRRGLVVSAIPEGGGPGDSEEETDSDGPINYRDDSEEESDDDGPQSEWIRGDLVERGWVRSGSRAGDSHTKCSPPSLHSSAVERGTCISQNM